MPVRSLAGSCRGCRRAPGPLDARPAAETKDRNCRGPVECGLQGVKQSLSLLCPYNSMKARGLGRTSETQSIVEIEQSHRVDERGRPPRSMRGPTRFSGWSSRSACWGEVFAPLTGCTDPGGEAASLRSSQLLRGVPRPLCPDGDDPRAPTGCLLRSAATWAATSADGRARSPRRSGGPCATRGARPRSSTSSPRGPRHLCAFSGPVPVSRANELTQVNGA